MNKFELISRNEFNKLVESNCYGLTHKDYEQIIIPRRATKGSAGYDFFSPVAFELHPGESIKIPTCIKCCLNHGNVLMIFPRSSYGFKYRMQLDNSVGIIDEDYYNNESNEGHIFMKITNDSRTGEILKVQSGDAIAQGIIVQYSITDDDNAMETRIGGIGSTSKSQ